MTLMKKNNPWVAVGGLTLTIVFKDHSDCFVVNICWEQGLDFIIQFYGCSILLYSHNVHSSTNPNRVHMHFESR